MTNLEKIKASLNNDLIKVEMSVCRGMLCCSINSVVFSKYSDDFKPLVKELEKIIIGPPDWIKDDVDTIWWDGHFEGVLKISDDDQFYWYCENHISWGLDEEKEKSIIKDLLAQRSKQKDKVEFISIIDGEKYRLEDELEGYDNEERVEEYGSDLGGYSLTHICKIPIWFLTGEDEDWELWEEEQDDEPENSDAAEDLVERFQLWLTQEYEETSGE